MKTYCIYETEWGDGALLFNEKGLAHVLFPPLSAQDLPAELGERFERYKHVQSKDYGLSSTLARYLGGERVYFDVEIDFGRLSDFERAVLKNLRGLSYGKTIGYKDLAKECGRGRAARAVGNVLAKNPVPIVVPCHRVLRSDGRLGGWSGPQGWKERLLELEGIISGDSSLVRAEKPTT
ncbi:MAG: methylated-DNA--[protein]-cysteine S-methyltransferase [Candidatus Aquicultor sp.]|nr:methylated-DNA--[protein]-cysteine S-methyltransferase [Candidatus Aquicultor sp.]